MEKRRIARPVLFISRTYPPVLGGMETLSFNLIKSVSALTPVVSIVNPYGKKALPIFLLWSLLKAMFLIPAKKIRLVHLSDGVMAPLGVILKLFFKKIKIVCNIHGLDVTYAEKSQIYKKVNLPAIGKLDLLIAVSRDTKETCIKFGLDERKIIVIPNGTDSNENYRASLKENLAQRKALGDRLLAKGDFFGQEGDFLILFLGRLIERKGLHWFIENVMTKLPANAKLIVAGSGPYENRIKEIVAAKELKKRVLMLGFVSSKVKRFLLNTCDILVMPNIEIAGDKEGFGITAIEAGAAELLPLVSGIEGLKDAITHKENGLLFPSLDSLKYRKTIEFLMENPDFRIKLAKKSRQYVKDHFDWAVVGKRYLEEFEKINK